MNLSILFQFLIRHILNTFIFYIFFPRWAPFSQQELNFNANEERKGRIEEILIHVKGKALANKLSFAVSSYRSFVSIFSFFSFSIFPRFSLIPLTFPSSFFPHLLFSALKFDQTKKENGK